MSECRPFSSFPLAILPRSCLNWSVFVCLCEWKCTLMNALVHCQLAECRPWRHCCSVTYTNMGMTRASLQYHSACFHLLPISLPPLFSAIFILCLSHWLFMCFLNILSPHFLCQFNFTHLCHTCILYTCPRVFSDFPVCYSLWHLCHLSSVLSFTSFGGKSL